MSSIQQHPHGVRMAESTLRRIQPLIFDENIADNFVNFEREWKVYQIAALSEKDKKVQAYTLLNLAGPDAILKSESFEYGNNESKEDPDVLIEKFREQCMPTKNIIIDRHNFNTCNQKQSEAFPSYLATIKILAKKCEFGTLNDELIRDRIVCGIYSDRVRKQLLREAALTLSSAVMICMASEQSDKNSKLLQKETNMHYVKTGGDKSNKHKQRDWHGSKTPTEHKNSDACYNCNTVHAHYRKSCPAYGKQCQNCMCYGHYATVCRKPKSAHKTHYKPNSSKAKHSYKVNELHENESESENYFHCDIIDDPSNKEAIHIDLTMMNTKAVLTVKIDTGAKINCISKNNLKRVNKDAKINSAVKINLIAYGGQQIETVGTTTLRTNKGDIMFHVVDRDVKTILGLTDTMKLNLIQLDAEVHSIVNPVIDDYSDLFDNTVLGKLPMDYHMRLDPTVPPVVCSARKIPVAMKQDVINELEHMKNIGVIEAVTEPTEWVSSMVAAKKKDGSIRLCIDPVHLNKALLRPHHPMKTIDDILGNMSNAKVFSILDAKTSFWQIPLDEQSSLLTTFITPNGRYKFLRMPYGITSGSEVFQRSMEHLFANQPCEIIVDDILVYGKNAEEHDANLKQVLNRVRQLNMKLNAEKCKFHVTEVPFVGHVLTADGVKCDKSKISAITTMNTPKDKTELRRFFGMCNYVSKFIPGYSEKTAIIRELLRDDTEWFWDKQHDCAFNELKKCISSPPVLAYYNPKLPVTISADASQNGLGCVCLQEGKPIAYASRSLTETEKRYAQIEKELLALLYACTKFDQYIFGRHVNAETDHQPLVTIMKKTIHNATPRIQKMILKLQRYNISLVYKRGKDLLIADALSRAYQDDNESDSSNLDEYDIMHVEVLSNTRLEELKTATQNDHTSTVLKTVIMRGWPRSYNDVPKEAQPYYSFRDELTVVNDIILRGQRFVIPESLQSYYTTQLHKGHPGIDATKRRANECMYWNKMYTQLEEAVKKCAPCNALKPHQQKEPLLMHDVPTLPWTHVSSDIFEWHNKHYIVTTDSYSGWYEIDPLTDLRSTSVIHKLKRSFSTHGIPIELQTDNGTQYVSEQFREFTNDWDIKHVTSSPRYPQSNGLAERAVRSAKELLEKCYRDNSDIYLAILHARNVPKDGLPSAAQRLVSRRTRTTLPTTRDMLKPTVQTNVHKSLEKKRKQNKVHYDKSAKTLSMLQPGDTVRMQTDRGYDKIAIIERRTNDPRSYIVKCNGKQYRRNRKHLLPVTETAEQSDDDDIPYPRHDDPNDEQPINDNQCVQNNPTTYHTRSGRACLPNSRYQNDYV